MTSKMIKMGRRASRPDAQLHIFIISDSHIISFTLRLGCFASCALYTMAVTRAEP